MDIQRVRKNRLEDRVRRGIQTGKDSMQMTEYRVMINGIQVTAHYSQRAVDEIFLPLLRRLTGLWQKKGSRVLVLLAAPPGCGKTTLASFLEKLSREREGLCPLQAIGMDGFHRRQEYLKSHTAQRDGRLVSLVEIKGAPITFDLPGLTERVKRVAAGEKCGWPVYDRLLHNPVEDALRVEGRIVLLEGNYLLLEEEGWRALSACADYTLSIAAEEALLRARLIDRRIQTGVDREAAVRFVDFSDMPNVRLCLEKTGQADCALQIDGAGDYHWKDAEPQQEEYSP